ncbi:LacI family DNA-binding transcriptional regulator [Algibacillus agarilyticus]|uniref:LacI family DNA-binding transcriptional regulator n=1 Tax=Algibacillus agarilyticus TaxID=2234133 RepID=UPI000DD04DF8|nr:LacI family DNA-binding transcriptional regulator [Algibacillus agarilyticus]
MSTSDKNKKPTIKDVAALAGVSAMTVTRALQPNSSISEKTKTKVLWAVKALNYKPNISARRLSSSRSYFVGLLYIKPDGSYVGEFIIDALKASRKHGFHLISEEYSSSGGMSPLYLVDKLIEDTNLDAVILIPPLCDDLELLHHLKHKEMPFVRVSPNVELTLSPFVCINDYDAAYEMTQFLINQGHTQIAFIQGASSLKNSLSRQQGFLDAMQANELSVPAEFIQPGNFTYQSGFSAAHNLFELTNRPTAIFAANDDMASATIACAHKFGITVPDDLSVVGFDNTYIAKQMWPALTTVEQPLDLISDKVLELIAHHDLSSDGETLQKFELPFKLIERDSVRNLKTVPSS